MAVKRALALLVALTACASPEARRTRGDGAGADPGNRDPVVEMHGGSEPYHDTPCLTTDALCRDAKK